MVRNSMTVGGKESGSSGTMWLLVAKALLYLDLVHPVLSMMWTQGSIRPKPECSRSDAEYEEHGKVHGDPGDDIDAKP